MFEFLKHKNVVEEANKETLTTNSSETVNDLGLETEGENNLELFYKTPGYEEAKGVYDIVGQEDFLIELQSQITEAGSQDEDINNILVETDLGAENTELIMEVKPEDVADSILAEQTGQVVGAEDVGATQGLVHFGKNIGKNLLVPAAAALTLAFISCDNSRDKYPRYKADADEKENVEGGVTKQAETSSKTETSTTQTESTKTVEKTTDVKPEEVKPAEIKPQPQTENAVPTSPAVEKVRGQTVESTLPTRRGVAEVYEKFAPEMLPSGDPVYGYLTLNDATAEAAAKGGLKPLPELGIYSLEVAKNPEKQGIPFKSVWILKLSEGKLPKPLIKDASFTSYISKTPNGVFHIKNENLAKYKADLAKSIKASSVDRAGKFSQEVYRRKMEETAGFSTDELNTILKWLNAKEAERASLVDKWVKPYQNRTGTIKDNK